MFEVVEVIFGAAVAAFWLLLGMGLIGAGVFFKRRLITVSGILFASAGVALALLVWGFCRLVDRDHMRDAEARQHVLQRAARVTVEHREAPNQQMQRTRR